MGQFFRVTQADVARRAEVSQAVVSLVLSGSGVATRRVSEATSERVLAAVKETGYVANPIAQRLAGGRTALIGVYTYETAFPVRSGDFYRPFLEGLEAEAQEASVDLVLFTSIPKARHGLAEGQLNSLRIADGCVLLGRHSHADDLAALAGQGYPFSFIGRRTVPGVTVPYVGADYVSATAAMVHHLHELGHRRIVLAADDTPVEAAEDRVRGFTQACAALGIPAVTMTAERARSVDAFDGLRADGVTGILASPDLADDLLAVARASSVRVPQDLSIARLGDPERDTGEAVDWTGFNIPRASMGARALRLVLDQIDPPEQARPDTRGMPEHEIQVPCVVTLGGTTAPPGPNPFRKA